MKENLIKKYKSKNAKIIIFVTLILAYISLICFYQKVNVDGRIFTSPWRITVFCGFIVVLVALTSFLFYKDNYKIEKKFIIIAGTLGMLFTLVVPIYQVADEVVHSYRAYDLARGRVFYQMHDDAMKLPQSISDYYNEVDVERIAFHPEQKIDKNNYLSAMRIGLNKDEEKIYDAGPTGAYTFIAYIPQSIGIFIGDILGLPIYFVLLLGRITNLVVWIGLGYLALKMMPIKKELMMMIMLLPMSINQASSLSPDALLNSCSFLLIAYIMYLKFEKDKVDLKDMGIIALITLGIVSVKVPYILINALLLTIPKEKFGSRSNLLNIFKCSMVFIIVVIINFFIYYGWGKITAPKVESSVTHIEEIASTNIEEGGSLGNTIKLILNRPTDFLNTVKNTIINQGEYYLKSFIALFGWLDTQPPGYFITLVVVVIIFLILNGDKDMKVTLWDRFVFLSIGIGLFLTLCAVSLQWHGAEIFDGNHFSGIQGRYFYPFALIPLLSCYQHKFKLDLKKFSTLVPSFSVLALIFAINIIFARYWM